MVLTNQAQVRRRRHAESFRSLTHCEPSAHDARKLAHVDSQSWPTEPRAFCSRSSKAGLHSFDNQRPLQLRDGGDDREDRLAESRARINLFAEADEFHVEMVEQVECFHEVTHGSPEA